MFSFIRKVVSGISWNSNAEENRSKEEEEEETKILDCIKALHLNAQTIPNRETNNSKQFFGQKDAQQFDVETFKCVHKSGKVTHLCEECGLIDEVVYFEPNQVSPGIELQLFDEVLYTAYKAKENEAERVLKVYALKKDADWEKGESSGLESANNVQKTEEVSALTRIITGRVTKKNGRKVYIESARVWCDLDKIQTPYIPIEGDWVELCAAVSLTNEYADLTGDILEVKSLKPLLMKSGVGRITLWSDLRKEGAIENSIYVSKLSCEERFVPSLGDEVQYDAIESDQEHYKWRALKIVPHDFKIEERILSENKCSGFKDDWENPFSDKNGITITPSECSFEVELNETKRVVFQVTNKGLQKQLLKYTSFQNSRKNSQLTLLKPKCADYFFLTPNQSVSYEFEFTGKFLGLTGEVFFFYFRNFTIAKKFEINVVSNKEMNKLLQCKFDTVFRVFNHKTEVKKNDVEPDLTLFGPKPWKPPKFVLKERKCVYNIPKKLWDVFGKGPPRSANNKALLEYAPFLKDELNFEKYSDRFHLLLYLEELELKVNFRKYELKGVYLERVEDYFVFEVPGLVEKRPSLVVGDRVTLLQPWSDSQKTKHVGHIFGIQAKEVYVKFHSSFHETYDGSECDISFEPNAVFFSRCHDAVNRAVKTLGKSWLFPDAVNEKPPQVNVETPEEAAALPENVANFFQKAAQAKGIVQPAPPNTVPKEVELGGTPQPEPRVKKIAWINKNLNERQKLAVVNVVKGKGRPLPYVIFGPPGTGKTVTLVEIILQIHRLMPDSRILVTSPSNAAADLICKRLIELGNLKPGQIVRLVALYRVYDGLIPTELLPYCTFYTYRDNVGKNLTDASHKNVKGSSLSELVGSHRITISTCVNIGALHYSGIPPGHFTHIVVDEAGQTSEPEILLSATFQKVESGQFIVAGDPEQLGPVVCCNVAKDLGLGTSLLQRLIAKFPYARDFSSFPDTQGFDPRFVTKLNVNYRTVPEILSLSSQLFYNSDLIPTVSQTDSKEAEIIKRFGFEAENRSTPPAIIFHGIIGQNYQDRDSPSWFNPHEIWQVAFYLRKLYSSGLDCNDVGIVTPYAKQVQKLKTLLPSLELSTPKIGSVEEFQGQERQVIIVTTVRSSPSYLKSDIIHSLGFVASPQRLNVAITRARALLIIIGNPIILSKDPYWVHVVKYCIQNNSYTGCCFDVFVNNLKVENDDGGSATEPLEEVESKVPKEVPIEGVEEVGSNGSK